MKTNSIRTARLLPLLTLTLGLGLTGCVTLQEPAPTVAATSSSATAAASGSPATSETSTPASAPSTSAEPSPSQESSSPASTSAPAENTPAPSISREQTQAKDPAKTYKSFDGAPLVQLGEDRAFPEGSINREAIAASINATSEKVFGHPSVSDENACWFMYDTKAIGSDGYQQYTGPFFCSVDANKTEWVSVHINHRGWGAGFFSTDPKRFSDAELDRIAREVIAGDSCYYNSCKNGVPLYPTFHDPMRINDARLGAPGELYGYFADIRLEYSIPLD